MTVLARLILPEGPTSCDKLLHEIKAHKYELGTMPIGLEMRPEQAGQLLAELLRFPVVLRPPAPDAVDGDFTP